MDRVIAAAEGSLDPLHDNLELSKIQGILRTTSFGGVLLQDAINVANLWDSSLSQQPPQPRQLHLLPPLLTPASPPRARLGPTAARQVPPVSPLPSFRLPPSLICLMWALSCRHGPRPVPSARPRWSQPALPDLLTGLDPSPSDAPEPDLDFDVELTSSSEHSSNPSQPPSPVRDPTSPVARSPPSSQSPLRQPAPRPDRCRASTPAPGTSRVSLRW